MKSKYPGVPEWTIAIINNYVLTGSLNSDFLTAVLENNLKESFARADDINADSMKHIVRYLYWEIPSAAWGSKEKVQKWVESGGLEGQVEHEH